jgi:hypothetical protein
MFRPLRLVTVFAVASLFIITPRLNADLLTNGGFELDSTGKVAGDPGYSGGSFYGWTQSGDTSWTSVTTPGKDSTYAADLGPVSFGYLSQTFATTIGGDYILKFDLLHGDGGFYNDNFSATIKGVKTYLFPIVTSDSGGSVTYTDPRFSLSDGNYHSLTFEFVADATSTSLQFAVQSGLSSFYLDNVNMSVGAPEPSSLAVCAGSALFGLVFLGHKRK